MGRYSRFFLIAIAITVTAVQSATVIPQDACVKACDVFIGKCANTPSEGDCPFYKKRCIATNCIKTPEPSPEPSPEAPEEPTTDDDADKEKAAEEEKKEKFALFNYLANLGFFSRPDRT